MKKLARSFPSFCQSVGESSESIRARIQAACDIQRKRFSNYGSWDIVCNANMRVGRYGFLQVAG